MCDLLEVFLQPHLKEPGEIPAMWKPPHAGRVSVLVCACVWVRAGVGVFALVVARMRTWLNFTLRCVMGRCARMGVRALAFVGACMFACTHVCVCVHVCVRLWVRVWRFFMLCSTVSVVLTAVSVPQRTSRWTCRFLRGTAPRGPGRGASRGRGAAASRGADPRSTRRGARRRRTQRTTTRRRTGTAGPAVSPGGSRGGGAGESGCEGERGSMGKRRVLDRR